MKKLLLVAVAGIALAVAGAAVATPKTTVSPVRHPNLAEAQRLCGQAWDKVRDAQAANKFGMGGHAERAKQLLEEASQEIKLAADVLEKKK
jgi:hypothetical protein